MVDGHNTNIVVVGMIVRDGRILISKRAATKTTFPDRFEVVGGHIDPGETLEAGLMREIEEEIGIKVRVGDLIDAFLYNSEDTLKIELTYICYMQDETLEPVLNTKDHSVHLWISEDEIAKFEKDDEETAALHKAFKHIKGDNK